jgi:DNA-binding response OmpR family regulator
MLANLRHELRTPLTAVIGYSEMLLEDVAEGEGSEILSSDLGKIRSAGKGLLALVDDALHPDKESLGANLRHDLRAPIEAVIGYCDTVREEAQALGQTDILPDLQKISMSAERFLALTDRVGDFSKIEAGEIPFRLPQEATDTSAIVSDAAGPPDGAWVRTDGDPLLIVDDDEVNRDVLARHLGRQGYATAAAENGIEALEMVRARKFDLMLLDVMMPKMDGYETLRLMKADPHLRDIPVIMISALDDIESVVRCIEMGAEDYLPKPFDPVLLRARIGACLEKKRLRDLEIEYLRNVDHVTAAAAAVEAGEFDPATIEQVAARSDELGQLARVFQRMAREVYAREQRLKQEVHRLRIEIDETKTARQVAEITETDYFQELQRKVDTLRLRSDDAKP